MIKRLFKKYWWIALLVLLAGGAFLFLRHSAKKKQAAEAAIQHRIDSLTIRARALDSLNNYHSERIQLMEENQKALSSAIAAISKERKNERHAYHKNITVVRSLPPGQQVEFLSDWLPAKAGTAVR